LIELDVNLVVYQRNPDMIIPDENCVELFSKCNFEGDRLAICSPATLKPNDSAFQVASLIVPNGKSFKLYVAADDTSEHVTYKGINPCIKTVLMKR
jgi:hypothetical protein